MISIHENAWARYTVDPGRQTLWVNSKGLLGYFLAGHQLKKHWAGYDLQFVGPDYLNYMTRRVQNEQEARA